MRAFVFVLLLLVLLAFGIAANHSYINNVENELHGRIECLPEINEAECVASIDALLEYWEGEENLVGLSVGYSVVDRVKEQILLLRSAAETGDVFGFSSARALLVDAVEDMGRLEQFSIGNLM